MWKWVHILLRKCSLDAPFRRVSSIISATTLKENITEFGHSSVSTISRVSGHPHGKVLETMRRGTWWKKWRKATRFVPTRLLCVWEGTRQSHPGSHRLCFTTQIAKIQVVQAFDEFSCYISIFAGIAAFAKVRKCGQYKRLEGLISICPRSPNRPIQIVRWRIPDVSLADTGFYRYCLGCVSWNTWYLHMQIWVLMTILSRSHPYFDPVRLPEFQCSALIT